MFFILSKLLFFLLRPINWVLALLVYAYWTKKEQRRKKVLLSAIVLFLFLGNHFLCNQVFRWWEPDTIKLSEIKDTVDIAILLGGYSDFDIVPNDDRHNFSAQGNRFYQTFELYQTGLLKKILLTGGSGEIFNQTNSEAIMVRKLLLKLGVPDEDIIVEADSRNTYENGIFTKKILDEKYPDASLLLLTSAWHMPRSRAIFKKLGLQFTPVCVDHLSERTKFGPTTLFQPDRLGFYRWELLVKEWVGYIVYKIRGYL